MRTTVSSVLVLVLVATMPTASLRAESGGGRATLRTSIPAVAKAFASSQSAADAAATADWNRLKKLTQMTRIAIRLQDGQVVHATFVEADDVSLIAMDGALRRVFARADITELRTRSTPSRTGANIGVGFGIVFGVTMGALIASGCQGGCTRGQSARQGVALFGMPVGLGFAGYYGLRTPGELIYSAP